MKIPIQEPVKQVVDGIAAIGTVSAIMQWIPPATAIITLVWVSIRLYETKTIRNLIKRIRSNKS